MEVATIKIQKRDETGTSRVRKLRDQNKVPGVLYGGGKANLPIAIDHDELTLHLRHHLRVYKLKMGTKTQGCYLKDVQWDVLTDEPLHVDFQRIDLEKPLPVEVEILYLGHPKGIAHGGHFVKDMVHVKIRCLPAVIPEDLEIKVEHLDLHEGILAGELELPEGCELDVPTDAVVCHMTGEKKVLEEVDEAAVAEGEGEAGGEAPAEGEGAPEGGEGAAKEDGHRPKKS